FKEEAMCMTLWEGLTKLDTHQVDFAYEKGCEIANGTTMQRRRACQIAEDADVILVTIGGSSARDFTTDFDKNGAALRGSQEMTSGENIDLATLDLPQCQLDLLFALKKRKKPLIGIVISGRPHCLAPLKEVFDGLLYAGYPGQYGGEAIARILFGETVPSGKLAVSIPDTVGQLPVCYNYRNTAFQKD
ncbi:beta-glucosidase, partial [Listeria monocytogenes]|nr:beta-glucosidase [Listeria monocytogenes]